MKRSYSLVFEVDTRLGFSNFRKIRYKMLVSENIVLWEILELRRKKKHKTGDIYIMRGVVILSNLQFLFFGNQIEEFEMGRPCGTRGS